MAQFDVHPNPDLRSSRRLPYLLDIQSDLLQILKTTVVIPLYDPAKIDVPPIRGLTPVLEINGLPVVMLTPELAGIHRRQLPPKIGDLRQERETILAALDIVLTGV